MLPASAAAGSPPPPPPPPAAAGSGAPGGGSGSLKSGSSMWAKTHSMAASPEEFLTAMAARLEPFSEKPMLMSCARMP
eukprot:scaffold55353_cov50-Phaeocystis_antarctica.AAC.2